MNLNAHAKFLSIVLFRASIGLLLVLVLPGCKVSEERTGSDTKEDDDKRPPFQELTVFDIEDNAIGTYLKDDGVNIIMGPFAIDNIVITVDPSTGSMTYETSPIYFSGGSNSAQNCPIGNAIVIVEFYESNDYVIYVGLDNQNYTLYKITEYTVGDPFYYDSILTEGGCLNSSGEIQVRAGNLSQTSINLEYNGPLRIGYSHLD